MFRVGQNRMHALLMTVNLVISLPKVPHIYGSIYGCGQLCQSCGWDCGNSILDLKEFRLEGGGYHSLWADCWMCYVGGRGGGGVGGGVNRCGCDDRHK